MRLYEERGKLGTAGRLSPGGQTAVPSPPPPARGPGPPSPGAPPPEANGSAAPTKGEKIFVGGLKNNIEEYHLTDYFSRYGQILTNLLKRDFFCIFIFNVLLNFKCNLE
uniref:RRM domain-containing protein n=1 Tax=Oryzias latipes TaxID=8090 RepID=A0A3P9JVI4_ORYLA